SRRGAFEPGDDLSGREPGTVADLQRRHRVDHRAVLGAAVRPHLVRRLSQRGMALGRAEDVARHRPHVPRLALGGRRPLLRREAAQQLDPAGELVAGEGHRLGAGQRRDVLDPDRGRGHAVLPFPRSSMYAKSMSSASSSTRYQRSPPGSFEICWSTMPVMTAVYRSRSAGSVPPASARARRLISNPSTDGAYDSGDGSNPGIVRWKSSWYRAWSSRQKST